MTDLADQLEAPPRAPVEWRNVGTVAEVAHKARVITSIVTPYDEDTVVEYPPGSSRLVTESFDPGAYAGVERRAGSVRANRDHDRTRPVGRAVTLYPSRTEGLIAEVRIARTPLGDETLALADPDEGVLSVSAGFAPMPDGQVFTEGRARRRIMRAFLDHIAYTADPQYLGATVLDVRARDSGIVVAHQSAYVDPPHDPAADEARAFIEQMRAQLPPLGA